jgi:phage terminase small subunit
MGTRGAIAQPKTETVHEPLAIPSHLTETAGAIFAEVAAICEREGYELSPMDGPMLELYATARADAILHEAVIEAEGWTFTAKTNGYSYPNPRVAMRDAALKRAAGAATKLGLAKLDRLRVPKSVASSKREGVSFADV